MIGKTPRFAVVGDNTVDRYLDIQPMDLVGGNALNVAVQLALAGHEVAYFGAVGADSDGELIAQALKRTGVDTSGLVVLEGSTALTEIAHTERGDRVFVREDFGVTAEYVPSPQHQEAIAAADWVHFGMQPQASLIRRELKKRHPHILISQDLSVTSGSDLVDVGFISGPDDEDPEALASKMRGEGIGAAIVTLGEDGAFGIDSRGRVRMPAVPTEVLDTTGAGDSFIAGFIAEYSTSVDLVAAMLAGATTAAKTCRYLGGWPQV